MFSVEPDLHDLVAAGSCEAAAVPDELCEVPRDQVGEGEGLGDLNLRVGSSDLSEGGQELGHSRVRAGV